MCCKCSPQLRGCSWGRRVHNSSSKSITSTSDDQNLLKKPPTSLIRSRKLAANGLMGVSNCRFAVRAPAPFRQLPARARRPPDNIATRRRAASRRHPKVARLAAIGVHAGATQSPQCFSQRQPRGRRNPKRWGRTSWSEAHAAGVTGAWGEGGRVGCARRAVLLFRRLCTQLHVIQ